MCKKLPQNEVECLIIDATAQPIEGHTIKTEICVTGQGRIVHVSKFHPNSVHDFTVFKREKCPLKGSHVFGGLKTSKIMAERYRNKRKRYGVNFNTLGGIINIKNGFACT